MIPVNYVLGTLGALLVLLIIVRCDEVMKNQHISDLEDQLVDQMHKADTLSAQLTEARKV
jgi:hypothetical protein